MIGDTALFQMSTEKTFGGPILLMLFRDSMGKDNDILHLYDSVLLKQQPHTVFCQETVCPPPLYVSRLIACIMLIASWGQPYSWSSFCTWA